VNLAANRLRCLSCHLDEAEAYDFYPDFDATLMKRRRHCCRVIVYVELLYTVALARFTVRIGLHVYDATRVRCVSLDGELLFSSLRTDRRVDMQRIRKHLNTILHSQHTTTK
jgi:hypothetical protein